MRHPSEDPEQAVGSGSSEFKGEVWTEYIKLGVICLEIIFKAVKLDEVIKGVGVDGEEEGPRTEPEQNPTANTMNTFATAKAYANTRLTNPQVHQLFKQQHESNNIDLPQ